jgi:hypothetical protein
MVRRQSLFGGIAGVRAGDKYPRREDLRRAGIHRQPWRGIDWTTRGALAIVFSGKYKDDEWDETEPTYTGEGGQDANGVQVRDQLLKRGNKALKRNMDDSLPVRVALRITSGPNRYVYEYKGTYEVIACRFVSSSDGPKIYRFRLRRIER